MKEILKNVNEYLSCNAKLITKKSNIPLLLMFLAPTLTGFLNNTFVFLAIIICIIGILLKVKENNTFNLPKGRNLVFLLVYVFSFLIIEFYAIDKGYNIYGFLRSILIVFYILLLLQYDRDIKTDIIESIPYAGLISLVVSGVLVLFRVSDIVLDNRLNGTLFYANSYALFLLIGVYVVLSKDNLNWQDYIKALLLIIGIVFTKSRAVELMLLVVVILLSIVKFKKKKASKVFLIGEFLLIVCTILILAFNNRFSLDVLKSSEFDLRLIYYQDALSMIKDNPFGYGYYGYYYAQTKTQTAPYYTKSVHNFVLQFILDNGIVPAICILMLFGLVLLNKDNSLRIKMLVGIVLLHSMVDINLEYLYFILLIVTFANFDYLSIKIENKKIIYALCGITCSIIGCFLISSIMLDMDKYEEAFSIIPFNSDALIKGLYEANNYESQLKIATKLNSLNKNITAVCQVLSREKQNKSSYIEAMEYERNILILNRLYQESYEDYFKFLKTAFVYYNQAKDYNNLDLIMKEILSIIDMMEEINNTANPSYVPTLVPSQEMEKTIEAINNLKVSMYLQHTRCCVS